MNIFLDQQMISIKTLGRCTETDCIQLNMQIAMLIIILVILYGVYGITWQGLAPEKLQDDLWGRSLWAALWQAQQHLAPQWT